MWCVELIPAELGASAETVYDLKGDSTWVFFMDSIVAWRTENVRCVELIPARLEASAETEGTVEPLPWDIREMLAWLEGFGMVSCGCPWMCGPRKVIHHYKWVLNKFNDWNYIYIWSDKT